MKIKLIPGPRDEEKIAAKTTQIRELPLLLCGLCPFFSVTNLTLIPPGSWGPRLQQVHHGAGATSANEPISDSGHGYFEHLWLALLIVFLVQLYF